MKPPYPERLVGRVCDAVPFTEAHGDAPSYAAWLRDYQVIRTLNIPSYWDGVSEQEIHEYCKALWSSSTDYFFAIVAKDGEFVGTLRAGHIRWTHRTADVGIMIGDRQYWGRGIGRDAVGLMVHWLFEGLDMRRLTAGAMAINPAMVTIFEALGFRREGTLRQHDRLREGDYCDHVLLGFLRHEFDGMNKPLLGGCYQG